MPFDEKEFSDKLISDLVLIRSDLTTLKALTPDQRRAVLKRTLNTLVDIPVLPEMIEALFFNFAVEAIETLIKNQLGSKSSAPS